MTQAVYPLLGPRVKSIFEYIRHEEETIHIEEIQTNLLDFFGLVDTFNYFTDFFGGGPVDHPGNIYPPESYGLIYTCDDECLMTEIESEYNAGPLKAGPAIFVNGSTKDDATGYALIYDPVGNKLAFVRFENDPLTDYPTVLFKLTITITTGQPYSFKIIGLGIFEIYVNSFLLNTVFDDNGIDARCKGVAQIREDAELPLPNEEENPFLGHLVRRFFYCDDGIVALVGLIPIEDPTFDNSFLFNNSITLKSGENGEACYGFYYAQAWTETDFAGASGRGYYQEFQFTYQGPASGQPISGIAFAIDETKSDPDDFTGYVGVVNERDGKIQLCYYENQSLANLPPPAQILGEVTKTLNPGNWVFASISQPADEVEANWEIELWTNDSVTGWTLEVSHTNANEVSLGAQGADRRANNNYGLVHIGNTNPGIHRASWIGTIVEQYAYIE